MQPKFNQTNLVGLRVVASAMPLARSFHQRVAVVICDNLEKLTDIRKGD
jgi:hypothetical protein